MKITSAARAHGRAHHHARSGATRLDNGRPVARDDAQRLRNHRRPVAGGVDQRPSNEAAAVGRLRVKRRLASPVMLDQRRKDSRRERPAMRPPACMRSSGHHTRVARPARDARFSIVRPVRDGVARATTRARRSGRRRARRRPSDLLRFCFRSEIKMLDTIQAIRIDQIRENTGSDNTVGDPDPPPGEAAEEHRKKRPGDDQYNNRQFNNPSPPPPGARRRRFAGISSGQFDEENPTAQISSGLLVQADEGIPPPVVDLIGVIYRNLP
ncbi:tobamovirus multiplication protein 2A [Dorcoceras hygrometricum]|uniref:Tobamovirus multiplication protein 2A n=1 Tax=Dorcoceras hygrometricum TaxID=472368 RepID=A0A2Z7D8X7_9LAMI|nr:tobamovirus multiplication protein 2A [Dorcoceras hygrometricum]